MRISDWSSDVCSSDLIFFLIPGVQILGVALLALPFRANIPIGAAMTFLSNPVTTPFIIAASVWLGDRMFGLHANVATFSVMIEQGATVGQWLRWLDRKSTRLNSSH